MWRYALVLLGLLVPPDPLVLDEEPVPLPLEDEADDELDVLVLPDELDVLPDLAEEEPLRESVR